MSKIAVLAAVFAFSCAASASAAETKDAQSLKLTFHSGPKGPDGKKKTMVDADWDFFMSKWVEGQGVIQILGNGGDMGGKATIVRKKNEVTKTDIFGGHMLSTFSRPLDATDAALFDALLCKKLTVVSIVGTGKEGPKSKPYSMPAVEIKKVVIAPSPDLATFQAELCK